MLNKFWALASMVGALLLFSAPASAVVVITQDGGGIIVEFEQRYAVLKAADELVIIDGDCVSACTLVLNIMPRDRVCVTERARLGFHNAAVRRGFDVEFSQPGTDMVYKAYPPAIKALLKEKGWDGGELKDWKNGALVWLENDDMRQFYRTCVETDFDPWYVAPAPAQPEPTLWQRFLAWAFGYARV